MIVQEMFTILVGTQFHRGIFLGNTQVRVRILADSLFFVIWESSVMNQKLFPVFIDSFTTLTLTLPFFNEGE